MDQLEMPEELRDHESLLKLLTIVFPCSVKTIEPNFCRVERLKLVAVFRENCDKKRHDFFSEPIIQFLWTKVFMKNNPDLINIHLRRIKNDREDGSIAVDKFIKSIQKLEDEMKIKFFSSGSDLNSEELAVLSKEEEYKFLLQNGKYCKRLSSDVK